MAANETNPNDARISYLVVQMRKDLALGRSLDDAIRSQRGPVFTDIEIEAAALIIKTNDRAFIEANKSSVLRDKKSGHANWYLGPKTDGSSQWCSLKAVLKQKSKAWTEDAIHSLDLSSSAVVSELAPPHSENPTLIKGLVLGYVQSGKTANFSAVIAKAIDEGYRLIVVLSGMHNSLRQQTERRLRSELVDPNPVRCNTLTEVDENGDFQKRQPVSANRALGAADAFTLVVLKKNTHVLRNFRRWLDDAKEEILSKCPALIIDDESDQASVNTAKPEDDPTAINTHVRELQKSFKVCSFIGYTATPFANVLVDSEIEADVFPKDFLINLPKPPTYFGAEELFGRELVNSRDERSGFPVIRRIPEEEATQFSPRDRETAQLTELPVSLKLAIKHFILGSAGRMARGQWNEHMTMLVHISHMIIEHNRVHELIDEYVQDLKLSAFENSEALFSELKSIWESDYSKVTERGWTDLVRTFDEIKKNVRKVLEDLSIVVDNSESHERLTFELQEKLRTIVIGGNTLSRGLTLEGLTTSYFVRSSKAYDTLLQMGRWFGYRPNYIDLTRIFTTDEIRDHFHHLATVEQEIRDEIQIMSENGERPIDVGLRIRRHPNLTVTAANKMRRATIAELTYSGTKIQARHIIVSDPKVADANRNMMNSFCEKIKSKCRKETPKLKDFESWHLFREVPSEFIKQFLESYQFSLENAKFTGQSLVEYIAALNSVKELGDWSVGLVSTKEGIPITVGGLNCVPVRRSILKLPYPGDHQQSVQLRSLSAMGDELVDLGDLLPTNSTRIDDFFKEGSRGKEIEMRRTIRPAGRGLFLIYPLESNVGISEAGFSQLSDDLDSSEPLRAPCQSFSVALVFPFTNNSRSRHKYVVNETV